jgi:hypothetical protein
VEGLDVRQTGAVFGFEFLRKNSTKKKIQGIQKDIILNVPRKEILIILKLHSGRLTDFRDVAGLCVDIDLKLIKKYLFRGRVSAKLFGTTGLTDNYLKISFYI